MSTIPRAPFYVPRHSDDPVWTWTPMQAGTIIATNTQLKQFGQHGQVPTHNFAPNYTYDDAAHWNWTPPPSGGIIVTNTQVKVFGQHGQVPTHNFAPNYTFDDPAVWSGSPLGSDVILQLSHQHVYSAGGQVATRNFAPLYTYDDASHWNWPTAVSRTIHPLLTAAGQPPTPRYSSFYSIDDHASWSGSPLRSPMLSPTLIKVMGRGWPWRFDVDDHAVWSGQPLAYPLTDQIKQQAPFKWYQAPFLTYDDPAFWVGQPIAYPLVRQTGQMPVAPFYTHKYDDATHWIWTPRASQLIHPLLTAAGQVLARNFAPLYMQDDAAVWSGSPLLSGPITVTRTQQAIFGQHGQVPARNFASVYTWDDASLWSGSPIISPRTMLNTLQFFIPAANARAWPFIGFDDYSIWTPQPYNSRLLPQPTSLTGTALGRWSFNAYYDEVVWPSGPRPVSSLLTAVPFFARRWRETLDDPPAWQGNSRPVPMTLQGRSPFLPFKFNFDLPDFPPWSMTMLMSLSIRVTPPPTNFKNFFTFGGRYNFSIPSDDPELIPPRPSKLLYIPLLLFKRIANAFLETRNALASKSPTSTAPFENRTASAGKENRTAAASSEQRTGNAPGSDT